LCLRASFTLTARAQRMASSTTLRTSGTTFPIRHRMKSFSSNVGTRTQPKPFSHLTLRSSTTQVLRRHHKGNRLRSAPWSSTRINIGKTSVVLLQKLATPPLNRSMTLFLCTTARVYRAFPYETCLSHRHVATVRLSSDSRLFVG